MGTGTLKHSTTGRAIIYGILASQRKLYINNVMGLIFMIPEVCYRKMESEGENKNLKWNAQTTTQAKKNLLIMFAEKKSGLIKEWLFFGE